jgi:hypothetical protein
LIAESRGPEILTCRANESLTQTSRDIHVLNEWIDNTNSTPEHPLTVNLKMIDDFEVITGMHGIGSLMVKAGFWRLSTQESTNGVRT